MSAPSQKQAASRENGGDPDTDEEPAFTVTRKPEPYRKAKGDPCRGEKESFRRADSFANTWGSNA